MNIHDKGLRAGLSAAVPALLAGVPGALVAGENDLVLMTGTSSGLEVAAAPLYESPAGSDGEDYGPIRMDLDSRSARSLLCREIRKQALQRLSDDPLLSRIIEPGSRIAEESPLKALAAANAMVLQASEVENDGDELTPEERARIDEIQEGLDTVWRFDEQCDNFEPQKSDFTVIYTSCAMLMRQGHYLMHWTASPDGSSSRMSITDSVEKKFHAFEWRTALQRMGGAGKFERSETGQRNQRPTVTEGSGGKDFEVLVEIGQPGDSEFRTQAIAARKYEHSYRGKMSIHYGGRSMPVADMSSWGHAYLTDELPGTDVIQTYYASLNRTFEQAAGSNTLFSAMTQQLAAMSSYGIPLEFQQTVRVSMRAIGLPIGMGRKSESTVQAASISVWEGGAAETNICAPAVAVDGYETVDMNSMAEAPGSAGVPDDQPRNFREALRKGLRGMFGRDRRDSDDSGDSGDSGVEPQ